MENPVSFSFVYTARERRLNYIQEQAAPSRHVIACPKPDGSTPDIWVLVNSKEIVMPFEDNFKVRRPESPLYMQFPYRLSDRTFHLAMVPREPTYGGPIFSTFDYTYQTQIGRAHV